VVSNTGTKLVDGATGAVIVPTPSLTMSGGKNFATGLAGSIKAWGVFKTPTTQTRAPGAGNGVKLIWSNYGINGGYGTVIGTSPDYGVYEADPTKEYNYVVVAPEYYSGWWGPQIGGSGSGGYPDGYSSYGRSLPLGFTYNINASNYFTSYSMNNLSSITYHGVGLFTINLIAGPNIAAGEAYPIILVQHTSPTGAQGNTSAPAIGTAGTSINGWALINSEPGRGGDGKVTKLYVGSVTSSGTLLWQDVHGIVQFIVIW
jgi:hypothetical protein